MSIPPLESWPVTARDQMTTTREFYESITNSLSGEVSPKLHRIIEVASGLNYQATDGTWMPSQSVLELTSNGGCPGLHGMHRVRGNPNLYSPGAVTIEAEGQVLQTRILGLYYVDGRSGRVVCLSGLRNCSGQLQGANTAVYRSALESIEASVEPDMIDQSLRFGNLWFPLGRGFMLDDSTATPTGQTPEVWIRSKGAKVCKTWTTIDGRQVLIEALAWADIQGELAQLPQAAMPKAWEVLPERQVPEGLPETPAAQTAMTAAPEYYNPKGFCIDWSYVTSGVDKEFESGQAYYVSANAGFSGVITFRAGSVIYFNTGVTLTSDGGRVQCSTTGSPTVLTSKYDPRFGGAVEAGCLDYTASTALAAYYLVSNVTQSNLRICWAQTGIYLHGGSGYYPNSVSGCTIESSQNGVHPGRL